MVAARTNRVGRDFDATAVMREQLRNARIQQGLTQEHVADWMPGYVYRSAIAKWEIGADLPTLGQFIQWAKVLGLELTLRPKS